MDVLSNQVIENVFPEERRRFLQWLREQKRRLIFWFATLLVILVLVFLRNIELIVPYLVFNSQSAFNLILVSWLLAIVLLPFWWPQKPGDFFSENFKSGLDPRIWEYDGEWKIELDENGSPVLNVRNSNRGGLALPCLAWTDYELRFETRIMKEWSGWIVRASSLNDYVHQKLGPDRIVTLYRVSGMLPKVGEIKHDLSIELKRWYKIRILARGDWLSVHIKIDGKDHLIFQDQALGVKPPIEVQFSSKVIEIPIVQSKQIVTPSYRKGSFGFRLYDVEQAQYRKLKAYRLR